MTTTAASLIAKAQKILQDTAGVSWDSTELLGWLNDGQKMVVLLKPNSNAKTSSVKLVAGTRQALPTDGVQLIDITNNMGTDGTTVGRAIRIAERETMDAFNPDWHTGTASTTVKHYMYSELDPKVFWNYPPQPSANQGYVRIVYGAVPTDAASDGNIGLDDIYGPPLVDYMLFRAYSKDTEYASDPARSNLHQQAFGNALGVKFKVERSLTPNVSAPAAPLVATAGQ